LAAVSLNALIEELGLLVRHKLKHQNIKLVLDLTPTLPAVMGEAGQLEQAFLNIILNSAEAMPEGGVLSITSRVLGPAGGNAYPTQVTVEFKDTGIGMSDNQRLRAFTSLLTSTKAKGTGLGLAIVGRIIETHQGEVQINSRVGEGTTITIILPISSAASEGS
jgi:signal transduction histidine kinase